MAVLAVLKAASFVRSRRGSLFLAEKVSNWKEKSPTDSLFHKHQMWIALERNLADG